MSRPKLTDKQRAYVVKRLAVYETLESIARAVRKKFGITISCPGIYHYHPERTLSELAQRWKDLFWKTRKAYLASTADVGFTDKPARIRAREEMLHREWAAGRHALANQILDSIAKDIRDGFGRKRRS